MSVKQQWSLRQKAFPAPYQRRISRRDRAQPPFFYDSDSISCLFSWCHLMTLTWGNIHLGQTSRRRSDASLEKVRIIRSADKGAQLISMISQWPPLWCAFWRWRSTTRDGRSAAWSHATGRQTKIFARSSPRSEFWFAHLMMGRAGVRNVKEKSHIGILGASCFLPSKWKKETTWEGTICSQFPSFLQQMVWIHCHSWAFLKKRKIKQNGTFFQPPKHRPHYI